jgi:hypothetical protein
MWRLAAGEYRFGMGGLEAAHQMLLVLPPDRRPPRQIHGLAGWWDRRRGRWRCKPIGYLWSDRLRGYDTLTRPDLQLPVHGLSGPGGHLDKAIAEGTVRLLSAPLSAPDAEAALAPALAALAAINALSPGPDGGAGLPYPFLGLGPNSNSVFRTLIAALGHDAVLFPDRSVFRPGAQTMLLDSAGLNAILQARRIEARPETAR